MAVPFSHVAQSPGRGSLQKGQEEKESKYRLDTNNNDASLTKFTNLENQPISTQSSTTSQVDCHVTFSKFNILSTEDIPDIVWGYNTFSPVSVAPSGLSSIVVCRFLSVTCCLSLGPPCFFSIAPPTRS